MSSLVGKHFGFDTLGYIVGIAKDFNFNSLHYKIETMFLFNQNDGGGYFSNMSAKLSGNKSKEAIAFIQSVWQKIAPGIYLSTISWTIIFLQFTGLMSR